MTNRQRALQPWWDWSQTGQTADSTDLPLWCEDGDSEPDNLFWVLLFLYLSEALISKLDEVKNNQHTTQFDVKIGAGMDIAIHGENGQSDSTNQTKHESNFPTLSNQPESNSWRIPFIPWKWRSYILLEDPTCHSVLPHEYGWQLETTWWQRWEFSKFYSAVCNCTTKFLVSKIVKIPATTVVWSWIAMSTHENRGPRGWRRGLAWAS